MKFRYIIVLCIVFGFIFISRISIKGDVYQTYVLQTDIPPLNKNNMWRTFYDRTRELEIDFYSEYGGHRKGIATFYMLENTEINNGTVLFSDDDEKSIHTGPYDLSMKFYFPGDVENVILEKIILNVNDSVVDLREIVSIRDPFNRQIPDEILNDFAITGAVNVEEIRQNEKYISNGLWLWFRNLDIPYKNARYFTIKFSITYVYNHGGREDCNFTAIFNRSKITERTSLLGSLLFAWAMSR